MKKFIYILLTALLVMSFAACGGTSGGTSDSDFEWSRAGVFTDGSENTLVVSASSDEEQEGMWAVTAILGEEVHGWFLEQEGETLHGDLNSEYDDYDDSFIVTISEEGDDGLMMETERGDTYHFVPEDVPETIATLKINVDGAGTLAYGLEGEDVEFDEDFPNQSTFVNLSEPQTYVIKAKADEGWKFVKWTKDGEDFSEEPEITVEVSEDVEYRAVFETE